MGDDDDAARRHRAMSGTSGCLYETEDVRLFHRPAESDYSVVLFGAGEGRPRLSSRWMSGPGQAALDLYEIVPHDREALPAQQIDALCDVITETNSRPAIAVGAGLGGLAALRHGRRAGCAATLAFSPIGVAPSGDPATGPDLRQEDLTATAMVAFDPKVARDSAQMQALRRLGGVHGVPLPFMGLRTERALIGEGCALKVFGEALHGRLWEAAQLLRHNRAQDDRYLARLSRACTRRGHYRWAAEIASKTAPAAQGNPELALARADALVGLGKSLEAVETLERLVVDAPQSARYWSLLADRYEEMGQDRATAEVLELALEVTENFGFCWRLIRKLGAMGGRSRAQAAAVAEMALEQWPEHREQIVRIAQGLPPPARGWSAPDRRGGALLP
ncbi:tetratricopeptide repeat protein [Tropicimonas isoalkanivorans]|nr:tetratricopeptide repeat protein [Tropicimonas isoalkanivorans]